MFVDSNKVCVRDRTTSMHFELEEFLPVDVLHSIKAVEHWQPSFPISVLFQIRNSKAFSDLFRHAVSPCRPRISGNQRSGDGAGQGQTRHKEKDSPHLNTLGKSV